VGPNYLHDIPTKQGQDPQSRLADQLIVFVKNIKHLTSIRKTQGSLRLGLSFYVFYDFFPFAFFSLLFLGPGCTRTQIKVG
jgi:hypothetical protein